MALARKCDICGKLYEPYNEKPKSENHFSYGKIDCCPDCMESILQHIERLKGAGND